MLCLAVAVVTVCAPDPVSGAPIDAGEENSALRRARFVFVTDQNYGDVFLAGTFNAWSTDATRMQRISNGYQVMLLLAEGEYQYKFVADGNWITDETAHAFRDDGYGGRNSVVTVDSSFEAVAMERGDGSIITEGLAHREDAWERTVARDGTVTLRVRTWAGDVERVSVWIDAESPTGYRMELTDTDGRYDYFTRELSSGDSFAYRFALTDGETVMWLGPLGVVSAESMDESGLYVLRTADYERFETPDWVKEGVLYQIFPERFRNGDRSNDPDFSEWYYEGRTHLPSSGKTDGEYFHSVEDWYDVEGLSRSPYRTDGKPDWYSFYGGDVAGVSEKLHP